MKKNIIWALLLILLAGCQKATNNDQIDEEKIQYKVSIDVSSDQTRVSLDGSIVTWHNNDHIRLVCIKDNNSIVGVEYLYIEYSSISEDGKSATFTGKLSNYEPGASYKYIAVTGTEMNHYGEPVQNLDLTLSGYSFPEFESEDALIRKDLYLLPTINSNQIGGKSQVDMFLKTDMFSLDVENNQLTATNIKFENHSAAIRLNLMLDQSIVKPKMVKQITFEFKGTTTGSPFVSSYKMDDKGNLSAGKYDNVSKFIYTRYNSDSDGGTLYSTRQQTMYIPMVWDKNFTPSDTDVFVVSVETQEGSIASVEIPARKLVTGNLYSRDMVFGDFKQTIEGAQREILIDIFHNFGGKGWSNSDSWLSSSSIGEWSGVEVDKESGYVTSLTIDGGSGELPIEYIQQLTRLRMLEVVNSKNNIFARGINFEHFGNFSILNTLSFQNCQLEGSLPTSLDGVKYVTLDLSDNNFTGTIPDAYTIRKLTTYLGGNRLTGTFPSIMEYVAFKNIKQQQGFGFTSVPDIFLYAPEFYYEGKWYTSKDFYAENELTLVYNLNSKMGSDDKPDENMNAIIYTFNDMVNKLHTEFSSFGFNSITAAQDGSDYDIIYNSLQNGVILELSQYVDMMGSSDRITFALVNKTGNVVFSEDIFPKYLGIDTYPSQLEEFVRDYFTTNPAKQLYKK